MMDIADASIVAGVLSRLFDAGWVLVATCNRTPAEFAASMLHREHPQAQFTRRITEVCDTVLLRPPTDADGSATDYRSKLAPHTEHPTFLSTQEPHATRALEARFDELTGGAARRTAATTGPNRHVEVLASERHGVARASFDELCGAGTTARCRDPPTP